MFCSNCEINLQDDTNVCSTCDSATIGQDMQEQSSVYKQSQQPWQAQPSASSITYSQYHPYRRLGGWLAFIAIGPLISIGLMAILFLVSAVAVLQLIGIFGGLGNLRTLLLLALLVEFVGYAVITFFCVKFSTKIFRKDDSFMRFYELTMIMLCSMYVLTAIMTGFENVGESIGSVIGGIVMFVIWTTYLRKSERVRVYMGSDEYLKHSIFFKNDYKQISYDCTEDDLYSPYGNSFLEAIRLLREPWMVIILAGITLLIIGLASLLK